MHGLLRMTGWALAACLLSTPALADPANATTTEPPQKNPPSPTAKEHGLPKTSSKRPAAIKPSSDDFAKMLERRTVRVAAPYSRSLYFKDKGREHGAATEFARALSQHINKKHAKKIGKRPVKIVVVSFPPEKVLTALADGHADIAFGDLTVHDKRPRTVDMIPLKDRPPIREILLTGPASTTIAALDDLAGTTVHARRASVHHEAFVALNDRFRRNGKKNMEIIPIPDVLEDEDMMEMLNAGLLQAMVADEERAKQWGPALSKITVHSDLVLRERGQAAWAIRKANRALKAEIEDFRAHWPSKEPGKEMGTPAPIPAKYTKQLDDPNDKEDWKRFEKARPLFVKYGNKYRFDPLLLAAQAYQESKIDQSARSKAGAIGVMQLLPVTGKQMGVGDVHSIEPNIHAGVKYMDHLIRRYFPDASFTDANRTLFALAGYHRGPGQIAGLRRQAAHRGLDPDQWFNNVEIVVGERLGMDTPNYVRNVYKYYAAYKIAIEPQRLVEQAEDTPPKKRH